MYCTLFWEIRHIAECIWSNGASAEAASAQGCCVGYDGKSFGVEACTFTLFLNVGMFLHEPIYAGIQKMAELELSDFHNLSEILLDLKLSPDDLRLPVPRFFVEEREKDIAAHKALLVCVNCNWRHSTAITCWVETGQSGRQGSGIWWSDTSLSTFEDIGCNPYYSNQRTRQAREIAG